MVKQEVFRWMSTQKGALSHKTETIFQYIDLNIPLMPQIETVLEKTEEPKKEALSSELKTMQDDQIKKFKKNIIEEAT